MAPLSESLDHLIPLLGSLEGEPVPLDGGITNRNFRVRLGGSDVVVRLPGKDTELLGIDRHAEAEANRCAAGAGVAPEVAALLDDPPCLVTCFVEGETMTSEALREPAALAQVAAALRAVHGCEPVSASFSSFRIVEDYEAKTTERGGEVPAAFERSQVTAAKIEAALRWRPHESVLCHNDLLAANFIASPGGLRIVDWEYSGMGDRYFDLGNFAVNNELGDEQEEAFLDAYFGEPASRPQLAALRLMRFMSDFREAMWGVLQGTLSDLDFDFAEYAEMHFDRLGAAEADPRFKVLLEEAGRAAG
ncbi:MAG TPA: choline kinase family protein [Solirubrobacterales bacterium]|nr:choline kinase family protein [Solirubrobacterales bacterium]